MGWLGLDDTDTLDDGCTTFTLHQLMESLPSNVHAGEPCLVRLWPFAAHRTRGNAATAVQLETDDEQALIQFLDRYWSEHIHPLTGMITPSDHRRKQSPTDPGMVWYSERPESNSFYLDAVRNEVAFSDAPKPTKAWGGNGRIGACAAALWPQDQVTWEAIAWRPATRWSGTERRVCSEAISHVAELDGTFMTRDPRTERSLISPRGTCPVLFGLRSTVKEVAQQGASMLLKAPATEQALAHRLFATNQATDDHIATAHQGNVKSIQIKPRGTTIVTTDKGVWIAFAESGDVKKLAQTLTKGDAIEVKGLVADDGALHIEKIRLVSKTPKPIRPQCPTCQRTLKSMGTGQGLRCPTCKTKHPRQWQTMAEDDDESEWFEPPFDARRHLARPLNG